MAKRRVKKRTHKKITEEELASIPKSMVIHLGASLKNHSLSQLVADVRNVMQPHTAINLRERKSNKLKDFIVMCGPLHVSDLMIFNQLEAGNITLRIGKLPRGPTLQFKVNSYSLCKDIHKILRHPKSIARDSSIFHMPPLLVLNGFGKILEMAQHEKLMVTMFQNMFPPIQPQSTNVSSIKRVLLISKNKDTDELELRHYAINTKLVEENRNVKKLIQSHHNLKKNLPRLTKNQDVSELLLDPYSVGGLTSDSEVEDDAVVEIQQEKLFKKEEIKKPVEEGQEEDEEQPAVAKTKRAIKLTELGPRINMSLMKIEEGLIGSSKTLYHASIKKTDEEVKSLEKKHQLKQQLKLERRAKQQAAVQAKLDKKEAKKARRKARKEGEDAEEEESDEEMASQSEQEQDEDEDEVEINPEDYENDSDLYSDVEV
ncbi:Ribosome biogenesis protein SSF2 [Candida viswanathii]|uniref:Ribosome biogenesis protein SSF2 n=1 Tax=Candida viswanathii TaxID=5486 RepID=A0A367YJE2_9ASCO|nr:Ribosome biogenesis protein SSF2 [Candida viswanathii]